MAVYSGTAGDDVYTGGPDGDQIQGLDGNDTLSGGDGADRLEGGAGNDILDGGTGVDILIGGPGDDLYIDYPGSADGATIVELAGEGTDEVRTKVYTYSLADLPHVENLSGVASYSAYNLTGNSGANRITGSYGQDVLDGGGGNDVLIGGDGGDLASFVAPAGLYGELDLIPVGTGGDFDVELATGDSTEILFQVRLGGGSRTVTGVGSAASMGTATLISIEAVQFKMATGTRIVWHGLGSAVFDGTAGSSAADLFAGTSGADRYHGYAGNDDISGGAGSDTLYGGSGSDILRGGTERDYLYGGGGGDRIEGEDGADYIQAGEGDDLVFGGAGGDNVESGGGDDIVRGGADNDSLFDSIGGDDLLYGEDGNDWIGVTRTADSPVSDIGIEGGAGWDRLTLDIANASLVHADMGAGDSTIEIKRMEGELVVALGSGRDTVTLFGTAADPLLRGSIALVGFDPLNDAFSWGDYLHKALVGWDPGIAPNPFATGHLRWRQSGADGLLEIDLDGGGDEFTTLVTFRDVTAANFTEFGTWSPIRIDEGDGSYTWVPGRDMSLLTAGAGDDDVHLTWFGVNVDAGAGDDRIFAGSLYGDRFLDGGAGADELILNASQLDPIGNLSGIETLSFHSGYDPWFGYTSGGPRHYSATMLDSAVAAGATLEVDGGRLAADESFDLDASAESDGRYVVLGNAGDNRILTGAGNDVLLLQAGGEDSALGGAGNDVLYFGSALSSGDVADGGAGRDAIVLQGHVTVTLSDTNLAGIESISIQSGANATFGDTANNFYDYDVTTADGNVAAGQQLIVNAQSLRAGEDFTFDGSAESDGKFVVYGGHGTDDLTGGAGVDVFFFEGQRWTAGDRVDGGAGRDALVISGGSGLTHIEFEADSFVNIESVSVNNRFATDPSQKPSYELVLDNGNVAAGGTLIVNGSSIPLGQVVNIDGRGVHDGNLTLLGGGGHDVILAGDGADLIIGGGGADSLAGGAGADTFRYDAVSDSAVGLSDLIADFQTGVDKIDLSRIDADTTAAGDQAFTWIGAGAFSGAAGELRVRDDGAYRWVEGDTNGDGNADFAIAFYQSSAPQGPGDFLL